MYTIEDILQMCVKSATFSKGMQLYQDGAAYILDINEAPNGEMTAEAEVSGSSFNEYTVHICYGAKGEIRDYDCECPAYETYPGMCKHCVAAALELMSYMDYTDEDEESDKVDIMSFSGRSERRTSQHMLTLIETTAKQRRIRDEKAEGTIELIPLLTETYSYYNGRHYQLTFKIGAEKKYVLRNLSKFISAVANGEQVSYGKQLSFVHTKSAFTKEAWEYVQLIGAFVSQYNTYYGYAGREMQLSPRMLGAFLMLNLGKTFEYTSPNNRYKSMTVYDKHPGSYCTLTEEKDGFTLHIKPLCIMDTGDVCFVRQKNIIYHIPEEEELIYGNLKEISSEEKETEYYIEKKDMPAFCGTVLPELEKGEIVQVKTSSLEEFRPQEAVFHFYLDEEEGEIRLKILVFYGKEEYNLLTPLNLANQYRDTVRERFVLETAGAYFVNENPQKEYLYFYTSDDDAMYQLLNIGIRQLEDMGEVYLSDSIRKRKIVHNPTAQIGVALKSGLLELKVDSNVFSREELAGILENYRKRKKYYLLKNGDFMKLEDNAASAVAELLDGLSLQDKDLEQEQIELPKFRACYVDQILQDGVGRLQIKRNTDYKALIRDMKNVADSDYEIPPSLESVLRPYQKNGYRWLRTLSALGFGGILADDMGLGKTLQTICYLLAKKETYETQGKTEKMRSLIICPASLVYNWKKELEKFAPELTVSVVSGLAEEREKLILKENTCDIWITSYDMLKRDVVCYDEIIFDTEIVDEAQNIKNHGTQAAKAVKRIQAKTRFALTGTPIENRLSELWSIFDYLMPGILGKYEKFRKEYELPIVRDQNTEKLEQLKRIVSPFILRRVKQEVLKELPEKMEQVVYSEMEPEQKLIYTAHVNRLLESLEQKSAEEIRTGKLQILAELTRLRQICCAPSLVYEDYKKKACKIDTCMELITEAVAGNHKVLLFSQFTSIFPILEKWLGYDGIKYYELTGATPKEKRMEMIEKFNQDDVPVFLISLKAGGTGLNLTAASIVIHFDPWWNLAAQNQATDRAHRIGQTNQVVVFKLIARGTIEEKIIGLQEQKQQLASQILDAEGISAATLTKEDFMEILAME